MGLRTLEDALSARLLIYLCPATVKVYILTFLNLNVSFVADLPFFKYRKLFDG